MKKTLKWQVVFNYGEISEMYMPFLRELQIGIVKLKDFPEKGSRVSKINYKGFLLSIRFYVPFIIKINK